MEYTRIRDLESEIWDLRCGSQTKTRGSKTAIPEPKTQDLNQRFRIKNPGPGPKTCCQGLGFILHPVWKCLA